MMKIKEVADLVGISVRTLHHYDEIGLLSPEMTTPAGYRLYSDDDLELLQHILFFKALDFPLKQIKEMVNSPSYDRMEALMLHKNMLLEKQKRYDQMIETIDKTIQHMKGEIEMTNQEKFAGFDFSHNPYEQEARERWGDDAVDQSHAKLAAKSNEEQQAMGEEMNAIYRNLASLRHTSPQSEEAQSAIKLWCDFLNENFGSYPPEAIKSVGRMYVDDVRFTNNIDQFGEGLAQFMCDAMAVYADRMNSD